MQNFILGAAVFFFAASIALNVYSFSLLNRSIDVLHFSLTLMEKLNSDYESNVRKRKVSIRL